MSLEELGLHLGRRMDAYQPGSLWAEVGEAVRHAGRPDHDVAWTALDGFVANLHEDVAFEDDKGLVVGVVVQLGPLPWVVVHEEERHRRRAVPATFEGAGDVIARQVVSVHVVHGYESSQPALSGVARRQSSHDGGTASTAPLPQQVRCRCRLSGTSATRPGGPPTTRSSGRRIRSGTIAAGTPWR